MTEIEKQHAADVKNVQVHIRNFVAQKKKVKIYHGSTNSTRPLRFERDNMVDMSSFNRIIAVNADEQFVIVEPNVPMDELVAVTLPNGLVPPVVMEFPGITVGGGIQGGAAESSSFKYGLFHDCCLEYELVLGNGERVMASPHQHPDLFYGTACSYGSLGIITLVKLRLIPAKQFVRLTYHTVHGFAEAVDVMKNRVKEPVQFIDGIMFSKSLGVVMTGDFSDRQHLPLATFRRATDEWFYLHAQTVADHHDRYEEIIPVVDYLSRYDRGAFWVGKYAFSIFKTPYTKFFRVLLNRLLKTRTMYRFLHASNYSQRFFVQDINLPHESVLQFLDYVDRQLHIYPIWLCPLKPGRDDKLSPACIDTKLVINAGVWGRVNLDVSAFVALNREVEKKVMKLRGRKVLYAHAYYPREEFWKVYDRAWYDALRKKYFAGAVFPDIYDKVFVSGTQRPSIVGGLWDVIKSPFRLPVS